MNMTETTQGMEDQQPQAINEQPAVDLRALVESKNIAKTLDKDELEKIKEQTFNIL